MLHAKTLVVDGAWSSVGSVNFDNRTFQLNDEATLCVQGEAFAARAARAVRGGPRGREEIEPERWNDRPVRHRARERALQLARREI